MLVIRMARVGRKNRPQYRIVIQEKARAPHHKHVAVVGSYDPMTKATTLDTETIKTYLGNGAQPSDTVHNLLVREGVIDAPKRTVKVPEKKEEVKEEDSAEASEEKTEDAPAEDAEDAPAEEKADDAPAEEKTEEK